ncbi:MAG: hypothetical protein QE277_08125 [Flectobacillus sp.]|nr:hypothetical protein [Flectobacillus sp.]
MFDQYNPVPFQAFFSKNNGHQVSLDYANRLLVIQDENDSTSARVHFSNSITHEINIDELLNQSVEKRKKHTMFTKMEFTEITGYGIMEI